MIGLQNDINGNTINMLLFSDQVGLYLYNHAISGTGTSSTITQIYSIGNLAAGSTLVTGSWLY